MKLTATALKVLVAVSELPEGTGARHVADAMGLYCGRTTSLVAGGYAGRLCRAGWLAKEDEWYTGRRGQQCFMGVRYWITEKGRQVIDANTVKTGKERSMKAYQKRVVAEKAELDGRLEKLISFIADNQAWLSLSADEKKLLQRQEVIMEMYSDILAERISHFKRKG